MLKNSWRASPVSAADQAIDFARRAVNAEARGHGDVEDAMHRLAAKTGVGYWTWWGLWNRRRKTADADLLGVIRGAYLLVCQRQLATLQHALAAEERQSGNVDADLVAETEALLAKIKARRSA